MPEFAMPYWDALRRWNAGGTSWCLPRKGTPGYDTVMAIRRGEPAKTREETVAEIVKGEKAPRKKRIRVKQNISLIRQQQEMETVKVPTVEEYTTGKVTGKKKVRLPKKKEEPAAEAPKPEPKKEEPKKELEKLDVTPSRGRFYTFKTEKEAYEKIGHTTLAPALKSYLANVVEGSFDEYAKLYNTAGVVNISKSKKDVVKAEFRTSNMKHGDGNYIVEPEFEIVKEVPAQPKEETGKTEKEKKERQQVKQAIEEEKKIDVAKTYGKLEPTPLTEYEPSKINPGEKVAMSPKGYRYYFTVGDDGPKIDKNIMELSVAPAVDAYNKYILSLNAKRGSPIRNAGFDVRMEKGKKVVKMFHLIAQDYRLRTNKSNLHYTRQYVIEPTFEPLK